MVDMTNERIARFSTTFDCDPDGTVDLVLNAGSAKGLTITAVQLNWLSEDMTSSSDVPQCSVTRFTGTAAGGSSGAVFSHTDGDTPAAAALLGPTTLGSNPEPGPQVWPAEASYTGSAWYLHGGQHVADFTGSVIYVAAGDSVRVRATKLVTATVYFYENLTP